MACSVYQEYPMVVSLHLALFSRIILKNTQFFQQFLDRTAQQVNSTVRIHVPFVKYITIYGTDDQVYLGNVYKLLLNISSSFSE